MNLSEFTTLFEDAIVVYTATREKCKFGFGVCKSIAQKVNQLYANKVSNSCYEIFMLLLNTMFCL